MARPEKLRRIACVAGGRGFKPLGRPATELDVETLRLDELEALRLSDLEGLYQEAAAEKMGVSRPTFARILSRARAAIARALFEERLLVIGDGPVVTGSDDPLPCPVHGDGPRRGRGCRRPSSGSGARDPRTARVRQRARGIHPPAGLRRLRYLPRGVSLRRGKVGPRIADFCHRPGGRRRARYPCPVGSCAALVEDPGRCRALNRRGDVERQRFAFQPASLTSVRTASASRKAASMGARACVFPPTSSLAGPSNTTAPFSNSTTREAVRRASSGSWVT